MIEALVPFTHDELIRNSRAAPETGYPQLVNEHGESARLHVPQVVFKRMAEQNEIIIPEGPWSLYDHPNRQKARDRSEGHLLDEVATPDNPIDEARAAQWAARGLLLTADTRLPIHPRAYHPDRPQVLTTPGFGMFTHFGFHYRYGPAEMANFILRREWRNQAWYLMTAVLRGNPPALRWGVPGGYADVDPHTHHINESILEAALRESSEEGGFTEAVRQQIGPLIISRPVYSPPDGKGRDTLFAWGEEWFVGAYSEENPALEGYAPEVLDTDEKIVAACWMTYEHTQDPNVLVLGPHRRAIYAHHESALARTGRRWQ